MSERTNHMETGGQYQPLAAMPIAQYSGVGPHTHGRYRKGAIAGWILGALLVIAGVYVAVQWYFADRVPGGTVVAGVDLSGLRSADATAKLEAELSGPARQPIALQAGDATTTLDPVAAGISFDASGTVDSLTEFSLHPNRLLTHLRGDYGTAPKVMQVDQGLFEPAAWRATRALEVTPVDGTVFFADGLPATTAARLGQSVSTQEIEAAIESNWLTNAGPINLPVESVQPVITQAATDAAYTQARMIASAPVQVSIGGQGFLMSVADMTKAISFKPYDGELVAEFDDDLLTETVYANTSRLLTDPVDAHFEFQGGNPEILQSSTAARNWDPDVVGAATPPVIVPGVPGTTFDPQIVGTAIRDAALGPNRVAEVALVELEPEITAESLAELGVTEIVSSFSTAHDANVSRTNNLRRAAELVTGILLQPGETFSLLDALNPINAANGFGEALVIIGGNFQPAIGGGLSQMATTAYNAGFFAGFEDTFHRPHTRFMPRYPAGREATIVNPSQDMEFTNNTPYGAVLQSWVAGGRLHVAVWSTPYFRVETQMSARTNITEPGWTESTSPTCQPQSPGQPGFRITNTRQVYRLSDGEQVINESNSWTYQPVNGFRCVGG